MVMTGTHSHAGITGDNIYFSQIVGNNDEGGRVFGEVKIFKLDKPILLGFPVITDQKFMTKIISSIKKTGADIFVLETIDKFYYEIGFLKEC